MIDLRLGKRKYEKEHVPLFYYSIKNFSPATVLNVVNVAHYIPENNPNYNIYEKITPKVDGDNEYLLPERYKHLPSGSLIVTDRATTSKYAEYALPLYYEYQLMYNHYSPDSTFPEGFVNIRKNNENTLSRDSYAVETREYPVASGRYVGTNTGGFQWAGRPISGTMVTARVLLPARTGDNNLYTLEYNRYMNATDSQYWSELVDERQLYTESADYDITPSSLIMTVGTKMVSGNAIYVQKNPDSFITFRSPAISSDKFNTTNWEFSVSLGNFMVSSGVVDVRGDYYICHTDTTLTSMPTAAEPPVIAGKNILRVAHRPLITPSSTYPTPDYIFTDTITSLEINNTSMLSDITSVDTKRGFVMLRRNLNPTDNIKITYNTDPTKVMVVRNIELNPTFVGSGLIDVAASGLGVAIVPSGTTFTDMDGDSFTFANWSNIVLYNLADNVYGDFTSGVFGWGASAYTPSQLGTDVVSGVIPSGSRFLGSITVNVSPEQNVELIDIRRKGGYDEGQVASGVTDWRGYADIGYWDGEPLPMAGTVIIQIPSHIYRNIVDVFEREEDLEAPPSKYPIDMARVIDKDASEDYSREQLVMRAANKYIVDTVERYLPAGVQYIIVDENMNEWPTIRSTF